MTMLPSSLASLWLTEAFALVGGAVNKHLSRDDVTEGQEHLEYLGVGELLWQVVNEDVTALGTCTRRQHTHTRKIRQDEVGTTQKKNHKVESLSDSNLICY